MKVRSLALVICSLLAAASVSAQNPGTGTYPFSNLDSFGFDSINPGNLNVHFTIPIVNKQGRGLPFQYSLVFDGLIWTPAGSLGSQVWTPDASFGLHGHLLNDGYKGFLSYTSVSRKCFDDPGNPGYYDWMPILSHYVYHDEFGVLHPFNYSDNVCTGVVTGDGSTMDGAGYSFDGAWVHSRSGSALNLPTYVNGAANTLNAVITDRNGNQITNNLNGTFTDTMGKTPLTISGAGTASSPRVFIYNTTSGTATVTISYATKTVKTQFLCAQITDYEQNVDLPSAITLADNSSYTIRYESTPGYPSDVTGRIASITLPTGGTIYYSYSGANDGTSCLDGSTIGLSRHTSITNDGTTSYVRSGVTASTSHTEITGPHNSDQTEIDFVNYAGQPYETTRSVYSGTSASGTLLAKTDTCYNGAAPPNCTAQSLTMPFSQVSIYRTIGSYTNGSDTSYNASALATDVKEYDYGSGSGARGSVLRETAYSYATLGQYLTDKVASVQVSDGQAHVSSLTVYGYDESAPTGTSGLPQHVSVSGARGNLTSEKDYYDAAHFISTQYSVDDTGQLRSISGTNPGTTYLGYDSATGALLTSVTPPSPNGVSLATSYGYDPNTGLMASSTDANGNQSTYQYDSLLRLSEVDYPDSGRTTTTYPVNYVGTQRSIHAYQNSTTYTDYETLYDGLGRETRYAVSNGQGTNPWYQVDLCPNQVGLSLVSSYPYQDYGFGVGTRCGTSQGDKATYDPLGRETQVAHADGTSVSYQYGGRASQVTDENGVSRITQMDGLGRITAVCEISSNGNMPGSGSPASCGMDIGGTGFNTSYNYDPVNHKATVTQGTQARVFQTDWLGRPTLVQEPETGQTTYSYTYNGTGLLVTRQKPKANQTSTSTLTTTTTQYDALGRVVSVGYSDGTPTKTFVYDVPQGWGNPSVNQLNVKGRLSKAWDTSPAGTVFGYDAMGRINLLGECTPSNCGTGNRMAAYSYDWLGNQLTSTDGAGTTATYTYSLANEVLSLTSSLSNSTNPPNILSNVQSGPNGPGSFSLGNGLSWVYSHDGAGRVNGGWACSGSTSSYCSGGTQLYGFTMAWSGERVQWPCDTVVNQCAVLGYDEFNRLTSRTVTVNGPQDFSYVYDRYGNRWQQNVTAGSGPAPQYSFNSANNQMSGYGYDAAGNMTNDGYHTYTYDAEGNITQVDGGLTASYVFDALNHRVKSVANGVTEEIVFNAAGQRVSIWNGSTQAQLRGQYYWGGAPVAYYDSTGTHFQHQDWLGTERARTSYNGGVEGTFTSLPFGDAQTTTFGTDGDAYHLAGLDSDPESYTDHAQFRQYSPTQGRWLSPDPYGGSYDFTNPQSFNRYTYVMNAPLSFFDPLGLDYGVDCGPNCVGVVGTPGYGPGGVGGGAGGHNAPLLNNNVGDRDRSVGAPKSNSTTTNIKQTATRFVCKNSPDNRILGSMEFGFVTGALRGGFAGATGGAFFEGVGAVPGAIMGGFIGGIAGAAGGVLKGGAIAGACSLAGVY
jgi:RHS repeat-associated protein